MCIDQFGNIFRSRTTLSSIMIKAKRRGKAENEKKRKAEKKTRKQKRKGETSKKKRVARISK